MLFVPDTIESGRCMGYERDVAYPAIEKYKGCVAKGCVGGGRGDKYTPT